jgi:hypothetical protein
LHTPPPLWVRVEIREDGTCSPRAARDQRPVIATLLLIVGGQARGRLARPPTAKVLTCGAGARARAHTGRAPRRRWSVQRVFIRLMALWRRARCACTRSCSCSRESWCLESDEPSAQWRRKWMPRILGIAMYPPLRGGVSGERAAAPRLALAVVPGGVAVSPLPQQLPARAGPEPERSS